MNTFTQSEVFFIISSVGFVTLWILVAILLAYIIRITHKFSKMINKVEKDIDNIDETVKEMLLDIQDSNVFRFLFGKRKRNHKK